MKPEEIQEAAKEAEDVSKYLRSWSKFDEIAEQAGCDMSAMDGREYETMWCDRAQFEKLCKEIEKRTIERCAVVCDELVIAHPGRADLTADQCAAAIRKLGEQ